MTDINAQPANARQAALQNHLVDIAILGAGYGGLHVAQRLSSLLSHRRKADGTAWSITLIDRMAFHQLTTELPRIVGNQVADQALHIPIKQLLDQQTVQFFQADIRSLSIGEGSQLDRIETSAGTIVCRYLVIGLGSISNDFGVPGVHQYMRMFLTTDDARNLRIAVARMVEDAARLLFDQPDADQAVLERMLRVIILGAGPTGVEVAGELAEFMEEQWQAAWRLAGQPEVYRLPKPQIVLIDRGKHVLSGWAEQTSQAVQDALTELGVTLRLNTAIVKVEPQRAELSTGEWLEAETMLWTGGVRAPKLLQESGLPTGSGGRVLVDQFQRVIDHPEIYVVGDSALIVDSATGRPAPPTADIALRSGETAALALAATIKGHAPSRVLRPTTRNAVSVGSQRGAVNLLGFKIKGRAALTIKDLIEWEYRQSIAHFHGYSAATVI